MGIPAGQWIRHNTSGTTQFAAFDVGDVIKITNSDENNGIYTINSITDDSTYSYMGLTGPSISNDGSDAGVVITDISSKGNRVVCLGDEDTGEVDIWSYSDATDEDGATDITQAGDITSGTNITMDGANANILAGMLVSGTGLPSGATVVSVADAAANPQVFVVSSRTGTVTGGSTLTFSAVSPAVGTNGWSTTAIKPVLNGSNANFIFTQVDDTIRVCDTNQANASSIKWYGYLAHRAFGPKGGTFGGYEEHPNILQKPSMGGYVTTGYGEEQSYGVENTDETALTNKFDIRRWLKVNLEASDTMSSATDNKLQLDDEAAATNIPLGVVLGIGADDDNDKDTTIGAERFLVRNVDLTGADSYNMTVYRGYAGTLASDITIASGLKFLYQYGCGFNFLVAENGTADSGTYMSNVYEFAQSFVYENDQESLLRTDTDITAANTLTTSNESRALDVTVYAHGPYPGRIKGGRIYQRISGTNQPWSLLVDINFQRGCRTALDAQYITWSDASGGDVPNGCFYCAGLKSIHPQIDTYSALNGFEPEIDFTSIGGVGERYQTSVIAGRRMFIANLQLKNTTGGVERFGDRIMYSEPNKFDTFPKYNFIDVSKGDAEDYVKLEFFADRLLAFKQHTLHVINIQNSSPAGWYLEKAVKHVGVSYPYSVVRTPLGVAWANQTGCHFFDGRNVSDLTQGKIKEVGSTVGDSPSWDSFVTGSAHTVKPVVMYVPKKKQLVILRNPDHGSDDTNQCYIYDFKTNSWVYDTSLFTEAQEITNSIVDWNNNLVYAYGVDGSNVKFKQISDTSSSAVTQSFITKDIDFGQPAYVKKIYKIYITYKNSGSSALADDMYVAVDGSTTFANSSISSPHSLYDVAITGTFAASQSNWNIATFSFSKPLLCQSLALKFLGGSTSGISINDISFEYRILRKRVS